MKERGENASGISDSSGSDSEQESESFASSFDQNETGLGNRTPPKQQQKTKVGETSEVSLKSIYCFHTL